MAVLTLSPVMDSPSRGDTAFAGTVALDDNMYWVANYNWVLDGLDWPCALGALTGAQIYDAVLRFTK